MLVFKILYTIFLVAYSIISVVYGIKWSKEDTDRKQVLPAFLMLPVFGSIFLIIFIWSAV